MTNFEEDSAVLKGLNALVNDKGYETIEDALEAVPARDDS